MLEFAFHGPMCLDIHFMIFDANEFHQPGVKMTILKDLFTYLSIALHSKCIWTCTGDFYRFSRAVRTCIYIG